jgi:pimeloyl-ACP methyl ester carboxylesterase
MCRCGTTRAARVIRWSRCTRAAPEWIRDGWQDGVLGGDPPDFLRQGYGEVSPDGIGHYDVIVAKLDTMHAHEPSLTHDDLGKIACRTLVMVADDDEVRLEHAVDLYRSLPDAELSIVPGTSHGLLVEKPGLCNMVITEFFTKDPVQTFAPIRRAASRLALDTAPGGEAWSDKPRRYMMGTSRRGSSA